MTQMRCLACDRAACAIAYGRLQLCRWCLARILGALIDAPPLGDVGLVPVLIRGAA